MSKLTEKQIDRMVKMIFDNLKAHRMVTFKEPEEKVFRRAVELVKADFDREKALDQEVLKMMDELEAQNPEGFQRYKMFPLLKRKLAEQKGIVL